MDVLIRTCNIEVFYVPQEYVLISISWDPDLTLTHTHSTVTLNTHKSLTNMWQTNLFKTGYTFSGRRTHGLSSD